MRAFLLNSNIKSIRIEYAGRLPIWLKRRFALLAAKNIVRLRGVLEMPLSSSVSQCSPECSMRATA